VKYLYLGLLDLYLPAVAAAIHLGQLEGKKHPGQEELDAIEYFRRGSQDEDGRIFFVGTDSAGDNVYILSVKVQPEVVIRAVESMLGLYGLLPREIKVVPCLLENTQLAGWGKLLSRLGLGRQERGLARRVVRSHFGGLIQSVERSKAAKR